MELREIALSLGIQEYPAVLDEVYASLPGLDIDICDTELIAHLDDTMNILDTNRDALLAAARALREDPARYLWGQTVAAYFPRATLAEVRAVPLPVAPGAGDPLPLLILLSQLPSSIEEYRRRGLTEENLRRTLGTFRGCTEVIRRNTGVVGVDLRYYNWLCLYVKCTIFHHNGFEFEIRDFAPGCTVLKNEKTGQLLPMMDGVTLHKSGMLLGTAGCEDPEGSREAVFTETADSYHGIPAINGKAAGPAVTCPKSEWSIAVAPGDKVLSIHLPKGVDMSKEHLDAAWADALRLTSRYYPEANIRAGFCGSWLLDPTLEAIIGPDSKIVRFGARFARYPHLSAGREVFSFVFPPNSTDLTKLPENTRLERGLKKRYLEGGYVHAYLGVFLPSF